MSQLASGKHRKPKDSSSTGRTIAVCLGAGVVAPFALAGNAAAAPVSAWDRIAECESGGRWNLPYGDASSTGGLQIQKPTWDDYGGTQYASWPYQATKTQQIAIAEKILYGQGPSAWTCNAMTGYPLGRTKPTAPPPPAPAPTPPPAPAPVPPATGTPYTVRSGDTLYSIAAKVTGNKAADNWKPTYEANRAVIGSNPNLIYPGQNLRIPAAVKPQEPAAKPASPPPASTSTASFVRPVAGRTGDGLMTPGGCISRTCGGHSGLDIMAPSGTPVHSVTAGTVVSENASGSAYGNHVVVKHAGGIYTLYAHLSRITVNVGDTVTAGEQIGNVGSTGASSGPHLHFEVRTHPTAFTIGVFLNPAVWLGSHGITV